MGNKPEIVIKDIPETLSRTISVGSGMGTGLIKTPCLSQPVIDGKKHRRKRRNKK